MKLQVEVSEETYQQIQHCSRVFANGSTAHWVANIIREGIEDDLGAILTAAKRLRKSSGAIVRADIERSAVLGSDEAHDALGGGE